MAKLQIVYEQGDEYTSAPGQARVRLMKGWDPDDYRIYILESWLTGEPGKTYDLDAGRDVPSRRHVEHTREVLEGVQLDWQGVRQAIARFDDLAGRWEAPEPVLFKCLACGAEVPGQPQTCPECGADYVPF